MNETINDKLRNAARFLLLIILAVLAFVIVLATLGWLLGWRTTTEFSNGFFIVGAALAVFGAYSAMGGFGMRGHAGVNIARTASPASLEERNKQMFADLTQNTNVAVLFVFAGLLLIGIAVLIPTLFG